jgi:pimeloyl-ACP methyl ester carboxylesterase
VETALHGAGGLALSADIGGPAGAPTVFLLHGGGQTRHSWAGAMAELIGHGYRVVNFDARGHGDSQWSPAGAYALDDFADDLLALLDASPGPKALVGASLGGATALLAAARRSEPLAAAIVLVDIVPRIEAEGAQKITGFMRGNRAGFATLDEAADAVAAYNPHRPRPRDTAGLRKNLRLREDGRWHWHWDPRFMEQPKRAEPPEVAEQLLDAASRVRLPTLLVRGLRSDIVSDAGIAELRGHLPALQVFDIPDAGHMLVGDRNDAFNGAVIAFLDRHLPVAKKTE